MLFHSVLTILISLFYHCCRYAPTILLLRHFDVFRNLASQEGSPQEQVGVNSEVASVIREYTEPVLKDEDDDFEEKLLGDHVRCKLSIPDHLYSNPFVKFKAS